MSSETASFRRPDTDPPGAWKRNPYVLMLVAIPASVVLMASVMIPLSLSSWDGVVADDYYKRGLLIGRDMERDERARSLGLVATASLEPGGGQVIVRLTGTVPGQDVEPTLHLAHATRGGHDQTVELARGPGDSLVGTMAALPPGRWHLELGGPDWRLKGEARLPLTGPVALHPVANGE